MSIFRTKISDIQQVREICKIANKNEGDVFVRSKKYVVDAKSLMGLFSLDFTSDIEIEFCEPITLNVHEAMAGVMAE